MSDPSPFGANGLTENQAPATGFRILGQFVRDFSFENPRAPESFRIETKPEVDLGVEMSARGREDGVYEVDLKLNVTATSNGLPMFAVELVYGGLFQIQGVADAMIEPLLLIEAPRFMFPFARRIIADATADGGFFPPFQLDPIDFETVYMTQKAQMSQQPAGQA